jgi:hypothetical protein
MIAFLLQDIRIPAAFFLGVLLLVVIIVLPRRNPPR